tara:strand:- start:66 stop:239 length:174 start_codon:yes stop_codon:yes gene_type:complete
MIYSQIKKIQGGYMVCLAGEAMNFDPKGMTESELLQFSKDLEDIAKSMRNMLPIDAK